MNDEILLGSVCFAVSEGNLASEADRIFLWFFMLLNYSDVCFGFCLLLCVIRFIIEWIEGFEFWRRE